MNASVKDPTAKIFEMSLHLINKQHKQLANSTKYFGAVSRNRRIFIDNADCERSKWSCWIASIIIREWEIVLIIKRYAGTKILHQGTMFFVFNILLKYDLLDLLYKHPPQLSQPLCFTLFKCKLENLVQKFLAYHSLKTKISFI